jgi:galactitol-specific phosphotransferase system IIB component
LPPSSNFNITDSLLAVKNTQDNAKKIDILYPSQDEQRTINNIIIELLHGTQNDTQKKKLEED